MRQSRRVAVRRRLRCSLLVAMASTVVLVGGCQVTERSAPSTAPENPESSQASPMVLAGQATRVCSEGHRAPSQGKEDSADDLTIGTMRLVSGESLATMTPGEWTGGAPTPDSRGRYFYKIPVVVDAGKEVLVELLPMSGNEFAGIAVPKQPTPLRSVAYHACGDYDTLWVGGFYLGSPTGCITMRVSGRERTQTGVLRLFQSGCR